MERKWIYCAYVLLSVILISCDKSDDENPATVAIEKAEANTLVDLTPYVNQGWKLFIDSQEYSYSGSDNGLTAWRPLGEPCRILADAGDRNAVILTLYSPEHPRRPVSRTKSVPAPAYNVLDQTTPEKLFSADVLSCVYIGRAAPQISGMTIKHANCLWDFEVINQPEGTFVEVREPNNFRIAPYKKNPANASYRAIVTGGDEQKKGILIYKGDPYDMDNIIYLNKLELNESNTYYKFTVRINDDKSAVIENLQKSSWTDKPSWRQD